MVLYIWSNKQKSSTGQLHATHWIQQNIIQGRPLLNLCFRTCKFFFVLKCQFFQNAFSLISKKKIFVNRIIKTSIFISSLFYLSIIEMLVILLCAFSESLSVSPTQRT